MPCVLQHLGIQKTTPLFHGNHNKSISDISEIDELLNESLVILNEEMYV
jgi:hypothetical protein